MAKKATVGKTFFNGLVTENPTFTLMLGMCPTLGVTTAAWNGIYMGLATTFVLVCSNLFISLLRKIIPDKVRIPCYIIVIASFVTMVDLFMQAFMPDMRAILGSYIPLIVVNCIIFARAESFAAKNGPHLALADGLGMGLGFTISITCLAAIREIIGSGKFFGMEILPGYEPMAIMTKVPGGFITLGIMMILVNAAKKAITRRRAARKEAAA
ncbi:MAG: electron transport complex subunit E [Clostridia bacterium]|nr:electron transport complex subunit E [Clostridia bacterium]